MALGILFLCLVLRANDSVFAYSAADAKAVVNAWNSTFYTASGTNAYIKDTQNGGVAYFWGQAEMIECVIDGYEWTTNAPYQGMITNLLNGFLSNNGSSWAYNEYNDDILWAVIAFARGGVLTGKTNYCHIAKANFDACYARAWDSTLGGGLYWRDSDKQSKNACVNGPGAIAAYLLYQIYGDVGYLTKASNIYAWERAVLFNTNSGAIYDAIGTNGVIGTWASTYNQGTFIGAANFLGQTNDATLAAHFTMMNLSGGGILPEYGIAGNNSGFNAIFLRWLMRFMRDRNLKSTYEPWLQLNAAAAFNQRRVADNLAWCQWNQPTPAGTNFYAWDCVSSYEVLLAADPTQPTSALAVPTDARGIWLLDATSGTNAVDASGNGNLGRVNNASWNSSGRINGGLTFNGVNSSVQISNLVSADFSLAFWVKTTQVTGSGQWYQGVGLLDADTALNNNDFGTGLVGGKFAFGVGNPDTTIVSSTSINNGVWHHCVATRERATGLMRVYVDGSLQAIGTGNKNALNATAQIYFGAYAPGGGFFNGSLDDIRIFARTLSSSEVSALYASGTVAPTTAPAGLTALTDNGRVKLSWGDGSAATSYNVKRSLVSGGPYVTVTNLAATRFTDTTVLNNRTYYYVVSAVNVVGESTNSTAVSANTTSLLAWLKADAISGVANGAGVATWSDVTGNGWDAIQLLKANQPTYVAGAMNGQPAVRFNAANNNYLWLYRPVQDDFTIIFVYQSNQGIGTGTDFWNGAGLINGEQNGAVNDFGISLNANGRILAGIGNPDRTTYSGTGFNNGLPHVVTFKRTKSTGVIVLYVDGTQVMTMTGGTQALNAPNVLVLGGQGVLNNFLTGDIAEVQIYNAPLTDVERLGQERALKCKYGLAGGLAPTVPAGLTGVAGNRRIALNWTLSAGASGYNLWRSTDDGVSYQLAVTNLSTSSFVDTNAANGQVNYYRVAANDACGASASSAAVGILLPLPALGMNVGSSNLSLSWPTWATDWSLVATTNLNPPVIWLSVNTPVVSNYNVFTVTLPIGPGMQFFRLASP